MGFYSAHPTPTTAWRLAVLMGANTRTYKFALGEALLQAAAEGRTDVTLRELAGPYALSLVRHGTEMPQSRLGDALGQRDFLTVAAAEAEESLRSGVPTDVLLDAAVKSMPAMVMQKFHNLAGGTEVPHRFYEVIGKGDEGVVRLTPELLAVAASEDLPNLAGELDARWRIVESSFAAGIGASLMSDGLLVDQELGVLTDKLRRRSVAGVTEAVIGFQYGRCLICDDPITPEDPVAVDHVFPFSLMSRVVLDRAVDLDAVWNLAPAHADCNGAKSNRMPSAVEVQRLAGRNAAIMKSPHPLRRTLELTLVAAGYGNRPENWYRMLSALCS